jgi:hypothetical protein
LNRFFQEHQYLLKTFLKIITYSDFRKRTGLAMVLKRSPFARLAFWKQPETFTRRFERFNCSIMTELKLWDKPLSYEGFVLELSKGGALFKPVSEDFDHLIGSKVLLALGDDEVGGRIVSSNASGYGIDFIAPLSADQLCQLLNPEAV